MKFSLPKFLRNPSIAELENERDLKGLWKKTFSLQEGMEAIRAFGRLGKDAYPFLIEILNKPNKSYNLGLNNHRNAMRIIEKAEYAAMDILDQLEHAEPEIKQ